MKNQGPLERICNTPKEDKGFVSRLEISKICRELEKDVALIDKILEQNHHPYCKDYVALRDGLLNSLSYYEKHIQNYFREHESD